MPNTERVLKTYEAKTPLQVAGYLTTALGEMEHPAFITIGERLLRRVCTAVAVEYKSDDPSGEKAYQLAIAHKRLLGKTLLVDKNAAFESAAKLSDFNLCECIMVKYDPQ